MGLRVAACSGLGGAGPVPHLNASRPVRLFPHRCLPPPLNPTPEPLTPRTCLLPLPLNLRTL